MCFEPKRGKRPDVQTRRGGTTSVTLWVLLCFVPCAEAQLPPWAGRAVEPTPSFLVVPPAPETQEPVEVREMRDVYAAAVSANHALRVALRLHDRRMVAARAIGDERLDPTVAGARDAAWNQTFDIAARWVGGPHRDLHVDQFVQAAADTSEARLEVALLALGMLHDRREEDVEEGDDGERLYSLAALITRRWSCSRYEAVPRASAHGCATTSEARRSRPRAWCREQVWWQVAGNLDSVGGLECREHVSPSPSCAALAEQALSRHQEATQLRSHSVEQHDPELLRLTQERYAAAAEGYRAYLEHCPDFGDGFESYSLTYNLADALFWSENYEQAAATYQRVRDWSWRDGRLPHGAEYAEEAGRRTAEAYQRRLDAAVAGGEVVIPALSSSPTLRPVPDLVARVILAHEIYVARVERDPEQRRTLYLLRNAEWLERFGYWDEARTRYGAVITSGDDLADEARRAIARMASGLGDSAEVERVSGPGRP